MYHGLTVCFAGSRHGSVAEKTAGTLIAGFDSRGFCFLVGCADGVDCSFRHALARSKWSTRTTVHCAFRSCVASVAKTGLQAICRISGAPSAAAALHRRTVTMVLSCTHLVLFPDDPATGTWGKGSSLAFNTAVQQHKRVFVVTSIPPHGNHHACVYKTTLFKTVSGYWVVPIEQEHRHAA